MLEECVKEKYYARFHTLDLDVKFFFGEAILMSTHNIGVYEEISKIIT